MGELRKMRLSRVDSDPPGEEKQLKSRPKKGKQGRGRMNLDEKGAAVAPRRVKSVSGGGDRPRACKGLGVLLAHLFRIFFSWSRGPRAMGKMDQKQLMPLKDLQLFLFLVCGHDQVDMRATGLILPACLVPDWWGYNPGLQSPVLRSRAGVPSDPLAQTWVGWMVKTWGQLLPWGHKFRTPENTPTPFNHPGSKAGNRLLKPQYILPNKSVNTHFPRPTLHELDYLKHLFRNVSSLIEAISQVCPCVLFFLPVFS